MPDPLLYLKAMGAAATVSALLVLAIATVKQPPGTTRLNLACVLGMGLGLAIGYHVLSLQMSWPPASGLDRFLLIVVPAALGIQLISGFESLPRWTAWLLRIGLIATIPKVLLHGSTYLSGPPNGWTLPQACIVLVMCAVLATGLWVLLARLSQRSPGVSIPLALCLAIQCAGLTVMMAGYIKGGAAAFPLAAALAGTTIGSWLITKRSTVPTNFGTPAMLGIGVVGMFGLLFIGRFFGRLSTGSALAMLLAPLLCWVTELPPLRHQKPWLVGSLRLILVAIPLMAVLAQAKRDFDRDMAPLLGEISPAVIDRIPGPSEVCDRG